MHSGMRRILNAYDSSIVHISEHFFELCFPIASEALALNPEETAPEEQVGEQVLKLITAMQGEHTVTELLALLGLKGRRNFKYTYLDPVLNAGLIEMTQPDSPNSPTQKYRLTEAGRKWFSRTKNQTVVDGVEYK